MLTQYALLWIGAALLAVANGLLRDRLYGPRMSERAAHQLSSLLLRLWLGAYLFLLHRFWPLPSPDKALAVGLLWLVLTLLFEFLFGHYVAGQSWRRLCDDYRLFAGRLWLLVLLWIALAPYAVHRLAG